MSQWSGIVYELQRPPYNLSNNQGYGTNFKIVSTCWKAWHKPITVQVS